MIDPIFGGFVRCLSLNPVPTLNFCGPSLAEKKSRDHKTCLPRSHYACESSHYSVVLAFARCMPGNFGFGIIEVL